MAPGQGCFAYVSSPLHTYVGGGVILLVAAGAASTVMTNVKHAPTDISNVGLASLLSRLGCEWLFREAVEDKSTQTLGCPNFSSFLLQKAKFMLKLNKIEQTDQKRVKDSVALGSAKQYRTAELETLKSLSKSLHDDKLEAETKVAVLSKKLVTETGKHLLEMKTISSQVASMSVDIKSKADNAELVQRLQKQETKNLVSIRQRDAWRSMYHKMSQQIGDARSQRDAALQKVQALDVALSESSTACDVKDHTISQLQQREAVAVQVFSREHSAHVAMKCHAGDTIDSIEEDFAQYKYKIEQERQKYELVYSRLVSSETHCQRLELEIADQAGAVAAQRQISANLRTKKRKMERKLASQKKKFAAEERQQTEFQQETCLKLAKLQQQLASVESTRAAAQGEFNGIKVALGRATERCEAVELERQYAVESLNLSQTALESSSQAHVTVQQELNIALQARDTALSRVQSAEKSESNFKSKVSELERDRKMCIELKETSQDELKRLRLGIGRIPSLEQKLGNAQKNIVDLESARTLLDADVKLLESDLSCKTKEVAELSLKLSEALQQSGKDEDTIVHLQSDKLAVDSKLEDMQRTLGLKKSELLDEFKTAFKDLGEELWTLCQPAQASFGLCRKFSTKLFDDMDVLLRATEDTSKTFREHQSRNASCTPVSKQIAQPSRLNAAAAPFTFPLVAPSRAVTAPFHHQLPGHLLIGSAQSYNEQLESTQGWPGPIVPGADFWMPLNDPAVVSCGQILIAEPSRLIGHCASSSDDSSMRATRYGSGDTSARRQISSTLTVPESSKSSVRAKDNGSGLMPSQYASQVVRSTVFRSRARREDAHRKRANKLPVDATKKRCFSCGGLGHFAASCGRFME